jgi:hypothetical protein
MNTLFTSKRVIPFHEDQKEDDDEDSTQNVDMYVILLQILFEKMGGQRRLCQIWHSGRNDNVDDCDECGKF